MCELLGVSAAKPVPLNALLKEFASHSAQHPNGWGLATFCNGGVSIEKEPVQASKSAYLRERLANPLEDSTLLAHIRFATIGNMEYRNCHPFVKLDAEGRPWVLIHNGTIFDCPALSPYLHVQQGETDSERILLYLVAQMDKQRAALGRPLKGEERFHLLDGLLAGMTQGNKLNLLLYDGELLYAYTNYANSLYVRQQGETAVFCTVPLREGVWEKLPMTALCAYRNGARVYQGQPHGHEYIDNEKDMRYLLAAYANL